MRERIGGYAVVKAWELGVEFIVAYILSRIVQFRKEAGNATDK